MQLPETNNINFVQLLSGFLGVNTPDLMTIKRKKNNVIKFKVKSTTILDTVK